MHSNGQIPNHHRYQLPPRRTNQRRLGPPDPDQPLSQA